jgi:hypothetical protein
MSAGRTNIIEISLIQLIFYIGVFLWNQHIGVLLSLSFAGISLSIVILSYLADWIEASRVPAWYYPLMWISVICPIVVWIFFVLIGSANFQ